MGCGCCQVLLLLLLLMLLLVPVLPLQEFDGKKLADVSREDLQLNDSGGCWGFDQRLTCVDWRWPLTSH